MVKTVKPERAKSCRGLTRKNQLVRMQFGQGAKSPVNELSTWEEQSTWNEFMMENCGGVTGASSNPGI